MTSPVATVIAALLTHAEAAAAALTDPITDVQVGLPMPRDRCVRIYWAGEVAPPHFPNRRSLNGWLVGQQVEVTAYWPVSDAEETEAAARITDMATFVDEIRKRVQLDSQLGGEATDLLMDDAIPELEKIAGKWFAFVPCVFKTDATDYPFAP